MPNLVGTGLNQVSTNSMLGGLAYQDPEHASIKNLDLKNLSQINSEIADTATDVFVYDTSKDSDGGAWRKRTQDRSWYNEPLGTAIRGTRKEFPAVAVIVCGTDGSNGYVHIYDGDDPDLPMWMMFSGGNTAFLYTTPTSVVAMNGMIFVGTPTYGLPRYDFIGDTIGRYRAGAYQGYKSPTSIKDRSESWILTISASLFNTAPLVNDNVNDVAITVLPNAPVDSATGLPIPTVAVATDGGVSVIKDDGSVVDITSGTIIHHEPRSVDFFGSRLFWTEGNNYDLQDRAFLNAPIPAADIQLTHNGALTSGYIGYGLGGGATNIFNNYAFNLPLNNEPATRQRKFQIGGPDNNIFFGCKHAVNGGLEHIHQNIESPSNGMVVTTTSSYNTGWMHGDCKGAFLSDTDDTNVTSSNLISGAVYSASSRITSYSYTNGSSTLVITDNPANADGYVNLTLNGLTASTTYVLTVTANQTYTPTPNYNCHIGNTADGTVYFEDNFTGTASQNITFKSASSGSPTLVLYSNYNGALTYTLDLRLAEFDRSVGSLSAWNAGQNATVGQKDGLGIHGTVTKTPVATGADLVGYSGFSASNYLKQPYKSDLDFGTGDFSFMSWIYPTNDDSGGIISRGSNGVYGPYAFNYSTKRITLVCSSDWNESNDGGSWGTLIQTGSGTVPHNVWSHVVAVKSGTTAYVYINGVLVGTDASAVNPKVPTSNFIPTMIGVERTPLTGAIGRPFPGSLALVRASASAPSPEQIKKIYNDEKCLFHENAKATLYGSSDAVTALAYDDTTNLLHAGTSAGRSEFQGLRRINNTTTAVTTAISAHDEFIIEQ